MANRTYYPVDTGRNETKIILATATGAGGANLVVPSGLADSLNAPSMMGIMGASGMLRPTGAAAGPPAAESAPGPLSGPRPGR